MNMKNEILKLKSDYEYVSQSENDIIFVNNTFINVYHVLTNKMQIINKVHVKNVCIDTKDNYLFLSTFESGCLSIYDLKEGTFLTKKTILRNYEIENISSMNDDAVILLRNKKAKGKIKDFYEFENDLKELFLFDYILCIYQIKTDKIIYIDLPTNIFLIKHPIEIKQQYIYPIQIINHNDLKTVYYTLDQHNKLSLLKNDLLKYDPLRHWLLHSNLLPLKKRNILKMNLPSYTPYRPRDIKKQTSIPVDKKQSNCLMYLL